MDAPARRTRLAFLSLIVVLAAAPAVAPPSARAAWVANGTIVCNATGNQANPVIAPDGSGGAYVAWRDNRAAGADIYLQHLDANGNLAAGAWPANGLAVENLATASLTPDITSDGAGGAIVVWRDGRGGLYAQRVNAAGAIQWPANGVRVVFGGFVNFDVVGDGTGGAIVAWEDPRPGGGATDIYARRVGAAGDTLWAGNGKAVCTAANQQLLPAIVTDGAGGAIIAWVDGRINAANRRMYAQRVNSAGADVWAANGVLIGGAENVFNDEDLGAASDGANGAYVAWTEFRLGLFRIFVQHVSSTGAVAAGWLAAGTEVPQGVVDAEPQVAPDGLGGCVVATAVFGIESVQLDRFAPGGAKLWTRTLGMLQGTDGPAVATDGAGGAFAAYTAAIGVEARAGHIAADGSLAPPWPEAGYVIATAANGRSEMRLTATTDGDAVAAWTDNRNVGASGLDTYALKLEHGALVGVEPPPSGAAAGVWLAAAPNPARDACTIYFVLPVAGPASLDLFAVNGRRVATRDLTAHGPGRHRVALDGIAALAPGVYVVRLKQGAAESVARIAIMR